jgi:ligand-binding sensor domain-containing protein
MLSIQKPGKNRYWLQATGRKPSRLLFCILLLSLNLLLPAAAQEQAYTHYDTKDGLAGSTVHGIIQDRDGFLWFATETGLSRFDGTHFKNFTREDGLPSNEVFGVMLDSRNRIWINSFKNALCYYYNGKIYNQSNDPMLKQIRLTSEVNSMAETVEGDIIFYCNEASYLVSGIHFDAVSFLSLNKVSRIPKGQRFRIKQVMGPLPLFFYQLDMNPNPLSHLLKGIMYLPVARKASSTKVPTYCFWTTDTLLIIPGKAEAAYKINIEGVQFPVLVDESTISLHYRSGGVVLYDIFRHKYGKKLLPDHKIHYVMNDREGNTWFSTRGAGVFKQGPSPFINYTFTGGASPVAVHDVKKAGSSVYIGTDNGNYWKLNTTTDKGPLYEKPVPTKGDPGIFRKMGKNLFFNYANSDYFGLNKIGINRSVGIKTVTITDDTVVMATGSGAFLLQFPRLEITDTLYFSRSTCAYKLGNSIYVGTLDGLYMIRDGKKQYLGAYNPLLKNRISSFAEGENGMLWVATYEEGVVGLKDGKVVTSINQSNSDISSNICRCLFASGNSLWIGTEKGLNKVMLSGNTCKMVALYNASDGLTSDIINSITIDGTWVYVGTPNGLTCFDESKSNLKAISNIKMTELSSSGKPLDITKANLVLPHKSNNLKITFSGISFLSSGYVLYRYRLLGLDDQWQYTKEQSLNYPSLPSGKYTLQVQAINKFGDTSKVLQKQFEIEKTLWEKGGFRFSVALLLLFLAWMATQWRINRIRKKEKEKQLTQQKMMELEQMALRAQMNPHFIFNCLNSIQNYILKQDVLGANYYLSKFAGLVRQTLEYAPKMHIPLTEEISYLSNYLELERLQMSAAFDYHIHIAPDIHPGQIMIPNMVIQPFVENAVKHGVGRRSSEGKINLSFKSTYAGILECIIEDNGPGINSVQTLQTGTGQEKKHESKGTSITQNRIKILNQLSEPDNGITLVIEDMGAGGKNISGTRVTLHFPI